MMFPVVGECYCSRQRTAGYGPSQAITGRKRNPNLQRLRRRDDLVAIDPHCEGKCNLACVYLHALRHDQRLQNADKDTRTERRWDGAKLGHCDQGTFGQSGRFHRSDRSCIDEPQT